MKFGDVIKFLVYIFIAFLSLNGQLPVGYSFRKKKFFESYVLLLFSLALLTSFLYFFGNKIITEIPTQEFDIRNVGKIYEYLSVLSALVCFLRALIVRNRALDLLNNTEISEMISFLERKSTIRKSSILLILIKTVAMPILLETALWLRNKRDESEHPFLATLYTFCPWIIASVVPNGFFGILVINKELMLGLTKILEHIARDVNYMQSKAQMNLQKPYYRMNRFCNLADELDELAVKYTQLVEATLQLVDLLAPPCVCALVCNLFGITAGLFVQYNAIADYLIFNEPYDSYNALINSTFLMVCVVEIFLEANLCNASVVMAQKVGYILQGINLLHADVRFKQSVEEFSLLVLVKKFKIQLWGLLELDVSLLHDVLSAVTSFLLILIQSDLSLRFSLT